MKKIFFLSVILFAGCSIDYSAKVESNTSWSGTFGDRTVDGSGAQIIELPSQDVVCCVVQKKTILGYLKVTISQKSSNPFVPNEDLNSVETHAEYGVVSVCNK